MNEQEQNSYFKNFACWLNSLSSFEFVTIGTLIGYILSIGLDINEQNSLGNWLELVGQIMLTFNAQEETLQSNNEPNIDTNALIEKINELERKIKELENNLNT